MKKLTLIFTLIFLFCLSASAQQTEPETQICYTRSEAIEIDKRLAERDALKNEVKVKDAAIETLKAEIHRLQIDLALKTGESIGDKATVVRLSAEVEFLLKNGRKKCFGIICIQ